MLCVYDNACNLQRVIANSDPTLLARVHFVLDRFHATSHVLCNLGFHSLNLARLLSHPDFQHVGLPNDVRVHRDKDGNIVPLLNTSVVEQTNAMLRRLRSVTSTMPMASLFLMVRYTLALRNLRALKALNTNAKRAARRSSAVLAHAT